MRMLPGSAVGGFPRSGTTWLTYIVTALLGGEKPLEKTICRSAHDFRKISHETRPILIVRDYHEAFLRHFDVEILKKQNPCRGGYSVSLYMENIAEYDVRKADALLVYYERLLLQEQEEIGRIANFLGVDATGFLSRISEHRAESIRIKNTGGGYHSGNDLHYHAHQAPRWFGPYLDDMVCALSPVLYRQYLQHYQWTVTEPCAT